MRQILSALRIIGSDGQYVPLDSLSREYDDLLREPLSLMFSTLVFDLVGIPLENLSPEGIDLDDLRFSDVDLDKNTQRTISNPGWIVFSADMEGSPLLDEGR